MSARSVAFPISSQEDATEEVSQWIQASGSDGQSSLGTEPIEGTVVASMTVPGEACVAALPRSDPHISHNERCTLFWKVQARQPHDVWAFSSSSSSWWISETTGRATFF